MSQRMGLLLSILVVALICEAIWPLRKQQHSKIERLFRNFGLASIGAIIVRYGFFPLEVWAADYSSRLNIGLIRHLPVSEWLRVCLGLLLLEYFLYWWHRLNHASPFFWRFHNVHHIDLDMDVSTASRFHFGELSFSSLIRICQIIILGIDVETLLIYQTSVTAFAQFHHANIRLPVRLESILMKIFVTPRMHGLHHSIVRAETHSNYSTVFSFWDRLHGSMTTNVAQDKITIGVPGYMRPADQSFFNILTLPFQTPRPWILNDGATPTRIHRKQVSSTNEVSDD